MRAGGVRIVHGTGDRRGIPAIQIAKRERPGIYSSSRVVIIADISS